MIKDTMCKETMGSALNTNSTITNETNANSLELITYWIYAVYFPIAEGFALILQLTLVATIMKSVKLRKPRYYLITSLAIGDVLWIVIITPITMTTVYLDQWIFSDTLCQFQGYLLYVLAFQTKLTLTLITYDRHQAICEAVKYKHFVTSTKYFMLCLFGWIYPCLIAAPPLFGWNSYQVNLKYFLCHLSYDNAGVAPLYIYIIIWGGLVFPCNIAILVFYGKIFIAAHKTNQSVTTDRVSSSNYNPFDREIKVAKGVCLIVGVYYMTSFPLTVVKFIEILIGKSSRLTSSIAQITHILFTIPHIVNPLLYGWMNTEFKKEFLRVWNFKRSKAMYMSQMRERLGTGPSCSISDRPTLTFHVHEHNIIHLHVHELKGEGDQV